MPLLVITSVGTGIGKTLVTAILCRQLRLTGRKVLRHQAGGFRFLDRGSGQRSRLTSAAAWQGCHAGIDRGDCALAICGTTVAPPGGSQGRVMSIDDVRGLCREQEQANDGLLLIEGAWA